MPINKADEAVAFMSDMTEHERMLQSILTNEVDPQRNASADTKEDGIEVTETATDHSTSELIHGADGFVAENNGFENVVNESKRFIRVLCLWC